jgi:ribosomal protein L40E
MPEETVGYVRLEWTCDRCGTINPGPRKTCQGCGAPQPEEQGFELPPQQELISDEEELRRAKLGPDVHCAYCGARNPADAETCVQCGAPLVEGVAREAGEVLGAAHFEAVADVPCPFCGAMNPGNATKCSACGASLTRTPPQLQPKPQAARVPAGVSKSKSGLGIAAIIGAILSCVALVAGIAYFSQTSAQTGVVKEVSWEHSTDILEMRPATHEDWRDEIPAGAEIAACSQKYRYTSDDPVPGAKKVCGTSYVKDQGSGYGKVVQECEYEVYDDWCKYVVDEWAVVDTLRSAGNDPNPVWPELNLGAGQREGERKGKYTAIFLSNDREYKYSPSLDELRQLEPGSKWTLHVNKLGTLTGIGK